MSVESPARVERRALLHYLTSRWKRSKLAAYTQGLAVADPGHGHDEICPVVYYDPVFDPSKAEDLANLSAYAVQEVSGYGYMELDVQNGPWIGQQLPLTIANAAWQVEVLGVPITVYPQMDPQDGATVVFALEDESTFSAVVSATWLHGVGFIVANLTQLRCEKKVAGSRAPQEAESRWSVTIAAPAQRCQQVAEEYAGVLSMLFRGPRFIADPNAVGTIERDMADSGVWKIWQPTFEPVFERPNRIGETNAGKRTVWVWYQWQAIIRRLELVPRAGVQLIAA